MYSRTFSTTVCLFWLVSMTWLVSQKVLPALRIGQPPSYGTILEAQKKDPIVGWKLALNGHDLGWALSETIQQDNGMTEIIGRVHFNHLPLAEFTPVMPWQFNRIIESNVSKIGLDTESSLSIDPLGKLVRFDSKLKIKEFPDPIQIRGIVEGSHLEVSIDCKVFSKKEKFYLPQNAIVGDVFSPQSQLPNLREGQTWTVSSFSAMEIQMAKVEGRELITWNDEIIDTWLVVYRNDPGRGLKSSDSPRDKLWVADDGRVLKQQTAISSSMMTVTRMTDGETRNHLQEMKNILMSEEEKSEE